MWIGLWCLTMPTIGLYVVLAIFESWLYHYYEPEPLPRKPATGMQLKAFTNEQGANFLLSLLDNFASPSQTDKEAAISVSQRFNGLPLGLRQAAYFMRKTKCLPAAFLDLYNQKHDEIE